MTKKTDKRIYGITEETKNVQTKKKPLEKVISFRVSEREYNLLTQKSLEQNFGKNPHLFCKHIISESLKVTEIKNQMKIFEQFYNMMLKTDKKINLINNILEMQLHLHFSAHPEPPKDPKERERLSISTEERVNNTYKIILSKDMPMYEKIIADQLEETE